MVVCTYNLTNRKIYSGELAGAAAYPRASVRALGILGACAVSLGEPSVAISVGLGTRQALAASVVERPMW